MQSKLNHRVIERWSRAASCSLIAVSLSLTLCTAGCLSPLAKHAIALSTATAPVVDGAAVAYATAEEIHDTRQNYEAVREFDQTPKYNPRLIQQLLSRQDITVRLSVLAAFQAYSKSLVDITSGTDSRETEEAAKSVGSSLSDVGNLVAPSIESTLGIVADSRITTTQVTTTDSSGAASTNSTTATTSVPVITPEIRNGISTGVKALADFLISKKVKKELPPIVIRMDATVELLCQLLMQDIGLVQEQEGRDYNFILNQQDLFIRTAGKNGVIALEPQLRREQIMKEPEIVRLQRASDWQLTQLQTAIKKLYLTHHALAAAAQGNNPESFKSKLSDLAAAGSNLGNFYSSLPHH